MYAQNVGEHSQACISGEATGKGCKKEINKLRAKALENAERGYQELQSHASQLELALCLFSNSATAVTEKAERGMALLEQASDSCTRRLWISKAA
jgi:hypothetical protein